MRPDGRFEWRHVRLSPPQSIIAGAEGYADTVARAEVRDEDATLYDVTIRLQRAAEIALR